MLMRILADNPGKSFTKNVDQKFVSTMKELLRDGRDMSVQQILRETLDSFEKQKGDDETLALVNDMWKKEQAKIAKRGGRLDGGVRVPLIQSRPNADTRQRSEARNMTTLPYNPVQQYNNQHNYFAHNHKPRGLPSPAELAQRVEEAKTSAKLLSQVVQSTPPAEVLGNELIKEFVERCQSATRSMQSYIHSDNPPPDEDTLLTLIETNDQLATAMSKHQRAMLQARKITGPTSPTPSPNPPPNQSGPFEAPANPPGDPLRSQSYQAPLGPPPGKQAMQAEEQNPFGDQHDTERGDGMQAPIVPRFGTPPPNMGRENIQPGGYSSGYQPSSTYSNGQNAVAGSKAMHDDYGQDEEEEEVVRKPVQYRF